MCQYANMQMCQLSGYLFHIVANRNQQFSVGFAVVAVLFADVAAVGDFLGISLGKNQRNFVDPIRIYEIADERFLRPLF